MGVISGRMAKVAALVTVTAALSATLAWQASAADTQDQYAIRPRAVEPNLPVGDSNPFIARGVSIGGAVALYNSSGIGPAGANPDAPAGTPERYVDFSLFPDGTIPPGVTITEAQGLNALNQIGANLASVGLSYDDVISMRVFLDNPPGAQIADFDGWNRAYRQYFANIDLKSGEVVPVPLGTADPAPPFVPNRARPSRTALEIATLPVPGWLVEVEVVAAIR